MNSPILRKATINTTTSSSSTSTATVMEDEEHKTCEYFFTPRSNNNNSNNRARTGSSSGQLFYLSSSLAGSQGCLSPGTAVPLSPASHSQPRQKQYQPVQLQQRRLSASEMEEYSSYGWATHWEDTGMDAPENNNHNNNGLPPPPPPLHSQQQQQQQVMSFDMDLVVDSLPPQLHPAVSLGMKRVSSCAYFSLQGSCSEADLHSLSSEIAASEVVPTSEWDAKTSSSSSAQQQQQEQDEHSVNTADWLYHDVITQVLTFLDASSLAAFSETARRCNFECFYFLQLQLQRALLEDNLHHHYGSLSLSHNQQPQQQQQDDRLAAIAGSWSISRLASLDKKDAESVVQEYLDSNSTLRTMPLSHSLAYIRQVLRRHGFPVANSTAGGQLQHPHGFTTSAAVLIGLVGAATVMSGNVNVEVVESFGTELPNMLFKVGFVGSLMGAARHKAVTQTHSMRETAEQMARSMQSTMRDTAEQMARTMQHVRMTGAAAAAVAENLTNENNAATLDDNETATTASPRGAEEEQQQPEDSSSPLDQSQQKAEPAQPQEGSISQRMYEAFLAASGRPSSPEESDDEEESASSQQQQQQQQELEVLGPNPYEHLPSDLPPPPVVVTVKKEEAETDESSEETQKISKNVGSCNGTLTDSTSNNTSATEANVVGNDQCSAALNDSGSSSGVAAIETNCVNGSDAIVTKTPPKMPSGCVGAYFRAIRRASNSITQLVQQQRRARFEALPDKDLVAQAFIDACCLDGSLDIVKDMVQRRGVIDAQGFYVGSDGTETCALHASAFHGATKVLEFLCGGIDERDASNDQGLCSVDVQDVNGWTALHFAAGANCVESIRILADRGASLSVTAENGYTPLQWAQRLQNKEAMEELQKRLQQKGLDTSSNSLSMIAHHFFALIPSH